MTPVLARPIAHRGLHGRDGPAENTIAAARAAIDAGYGIECDVRLTGDGEAVVVHDDDLRRLTGAALRCATADVATLGTLALGDGSRIPTLAAFLDAIAGRAPLVIEVKAAGDDRSAARLLARVCALVAGYGGPVALESFDAGVVARCAAAPCPVGLVGPPADGGAATLPPRCDFLSWRVDRLAEAATLRPALPLTAWTVRDAAGFQAARRHGAQIVFEGFLP